MTTKQSFLPEENSQVCAFFPLSILYTVIICHGHETEDSRVHVCLVFSLTVLSDDGSPMTNFNPAAASMWLWQGTPEAQTPPPTVRHQLTDNLQREVSHLCLSV